jgi:DNA helicase II / ATP-dependent DNA helicase PcrA
MKIELDGKSLPNFKAYLQEKMEYIEVLSSLKVLYENIRTYEKSSQENFLTVNDFIDYFNMLKNAKVNIVNTLKTGSNLDGVNLMSIHASKGLEFDYVILLNTTQDKWFKKGKAFILPTPINLTLREDKENEEDFLRLYFVAITRAKNEVLITYSKMSTKGKVQNILSFNTLRQDTIEHISFANTSELENGHGVGAYVFDSFHHNIELGLKIKPKLKYDINAMLKSRLESYKISVTHLNNFLNIVGMDEDSRLGPTHFRDVNLLNFPSYKPEDAKYGTAIHETLALFIQNELKKFTIRDLEKEIEVLLSIFKKRLEKQMLKRDKFQSFLQKGCNNLTSYWKKSEYDLEKYDYKFEFEFSNQEVYVGSAHLSGNIDLIQINKKTGEIDIIDFKTGSPISDFENKSKGISKYIKAQSYLRQLQFYKILFSRSKSFHDKISKVRFGKLVFIDAKEGEKHELIFDLQGFDQKNLELLIEKVWDKIMNLDFPDIKNKYSNELSSLSKFIEDLINGSI